MTRRFRVAATGGTFDEIHSGHLALLSKAFEVADSVIIGVSSDEFAARRGKKLNHDFDKRVSNLETAIKENFGKVNYNIARLDGDFGPAVTSGDVDALVASTETSVKGQMLNAARAGKGLKPVQVVAVGIVMAQDGRPISSTRIRRGEIDKEGRVRSGSKL